MRLRDDGCVLCGSTWGDHWEEVDGERRFFCCALCARQLKSLLRGIERATGWDRIEALRLEGDRRGRVARASHGSDEAAFSFVFGEDGEVRRLRPVPPPA